VLVQLNPAEEFISLSTPNSAYVHIPFCRRRCYYCDFPISVVGGVHGDTSGTIRQYAEALCQEIAVTPPIGQPLQTIFFGGGTPSLLSVGQLASILEQLEQRFGISPNAEISLEMDPDTFDLNKLQGYRIAGINRVSLGVQAFQPQLLQTCGRSHTVADIYTAVEILQRVGVTNFSLDLISGLPHQTLENWQATLDAAKAIAPTHISIYDLTVEPGTVFSRYYQPGVQPLPSDETTVQMYRQGRQSLVSAGYEHYEISNYAQPGYQCRHNRVYWENRPYYGFGMGAASYVQRQRFTRPRKTKEYYAWVEQLVASGGVINCPQTEAKEVLLETLMLGLRLAEGISLAGLAVQFGKEVRAQIEHLLQPYQEKGWVDIVEKSNDRQLLLTDPEGFLFSNVILADLFSQL